MTVGILALLATVAASVRHRRRNFQAALPQRISSLNNLELTCIMTIEQSYSHFLTLTGEPAAAAMLTLAVAQNSQPSESEWLTAKELSARLGISISSVYRRIADGTLPEPTRIGRLVRWRNDGQYLQA